MAAIIGIDPGKRGGIAILTNGKIIVKETPLIKGDLDISSMANYITQCSQGVAFIEAVHAHPKQGVTSMFTFGKGYGIWIGILAAFGFGINYIQPMIWKKYFKLGKNKEDSIKKAKELYPQINLVPERAKKESDGMAEALLILHYGKENII